MMQKMSKEDSPLPVERHVIKDPDLAEDPIVLPDHLQSLVDKAMREMEQDEERE
jgi:hypothetical protein